MIILVGAMIGLLLAVLFPVHFTPVYSRYVAIAILAGLDSVVGGIAAFSRKRFDTKVFVTGVVSNSLLAAGLVYLGTRLNFDMSIAAVVTFGSRIFQNMAVLRRVLLKKLGI